MPIIHTDIQDIDHTVYRPVVKSIVEDIAACLGISNKIKVFYSGSQDPDDIQLPRSIIRDDLYGQTTHVVVTLEERFIDTHFNNTARKVSENTPVFFDKERWISLEPKYARVELLFQMQMHFPDKVQANRALTRMRDQASQFLEVQMHEVRYNYLIPKVNSVILTNLYDTLAKTKQDVYPTMRDWFQTYKDDRIFTQSNHSGEHLALAVDETQGRLVGRWDISRVDEKAESGESKSRHSVQLNYTLRFDKPIGFIMDYPILICNQPISMDYVDHTKPYELADRLQLPSILTRDLDYFTANNLKVGFLQGVPIPIFNEWQPNLPPPFMEGLMRVMLQVSKDHPRRLFNFNELGEVQLTTPLWNYVKANYKNITKIHDSVVWLAVYEDDKLLGEDKVQVDSDLNVTTTFDMDICKHYQVFFAINMAPYKLSTSAKNFLKHHGELANQLFIAMDGRLEHQGLLPYIRSDGSISVNEFKRVLEYFSAKKFPISGAPRKAFYVGRFILSAKRS